MSKDHPSTTGLTDSAPLLRALVELSPDGLVVVDERGAIILVNEATERIFGYPAGTLVGQPLSVLVPEASRPEHDRWVDQYRAEGRARAMGQGERLGRRADGQLVPLDVMLAPVPFEGQRLVLATVREASARLAQAAAGNVKTLAEQQARDNQTLARVGSAPDTQVTRESLGLRPLRQAAPEVFTRLRARYVALIEASVERLAFKGSEPADGAQAFADTLGSYQAGPRDLVEVHTSALDLLHTSSPQPRASSLQHEATLVLLEVMGHLTALYRRRSLGMPPSGRPEDKRGKHG